MTTSATPRDPDRSFSVRVLIAGSLTIALIALSLLLWHTADVILLMFAGALFGVFLRSLMRVVMRFARVGAGTAMLLVLLIMIAAITASVVLIAPSISDQFDQFLQRLPEAIRAATAYLDRFAVARRFLATHHDAGQMVSAGMLGKIGGIFASTAGLVGGFLIIFFIGLYGALEPELYRTGILRLVPGSRRARAGVVLDAITDSLRAWLNTRLLAMLVIGLLTWIGLAILGIPLALALGLIAAILTFIPYIGPTIAAAPALLMALMQSPAKALWVLLVFVVIHLIEAYLLTPFIQRRAMSLSPVLAIFTQVIFGAIWGLLGIALATPLTAIGVVLVEMLYIQDTLGERAEIGAGSEAG